MYSSHRHDPLAVSASVCAHMGIYRCVISTPKRRNYNLYAFLHLPWDLEQLWSLNDSVNTGGLSDPRAK